MRARITLLPSGQVIGTEEGETILDAALRAGINLPHSCRAGHCSSCRAKIVAGSIRYRGGSRPLGLMEQEERDGYALLCQAMPATPEVSTQVREIKPAPEILVRYLPCRIEKLQPLAPDVMAVFLRLPAAEVFAFAAGQYVDVMLSENRRRSFSIANPPHDAQLLELHVRRIANGEFTNQVFSEDKLKALLRIEGPLGQLWFREASERPAILVGGGTGYAPLRSMLRHLLERGDRRPLHLYWGAQTRDGFYEDANIREWCARYPNLSYTPVLANAMEGWSGRTGWVHSAVIEDHPSLRDFDIYAAGPPAMIEALRADFLARGLPAEQLFFDSFDFAPPAPQK
jgi:CDP-4-dehydro-6-deoxyglucose reductase